MPKITPGFGRDPSESATAAAHTRAKPGVLDLQRPRPRERRTLWRERDSNHRSPQNSDTFETALFRRGRTDSVAKGTGGSNPSPSTISSRTVSLAPRCATSARSGTIGRCTSAECLNESSTTRSDGSSSRRQRFHDTDRVATVPRPRLGQPP
jgi:hypothetical protein